MVSRKVRIFLIASGSGKSEPLFLIGEIMRHNPKSSANMEIILDSESARERQKQSVKKRVENAERRKNMREIATYLLDMSARGKLKEAMKQFGELEESDTTYRTAVVIKLIEKALKTGDVPAIRLLGEITGDVRKFGETVEEKLESLSNYEFPALCLPDNGRDKKTINAIRPQAGPQTMFLMSSADIVIYGGAAGGGKALSLDSLILTPNGFVKNRDIHVGDKVWATDGFSTVMQIHPQPPGHMYEIEFDDGAKVKCNYEHLWTVCIEGEYRTIPISEIIPLIDSGVRVEFPLTDPVEFDVKPVLPVKPYTFGVLLAGGSDSGRITESNIEVFKHIEEEGYKLIYEKRTKNYWTANINIKPHLTGIPDSYKYASIEDRFSLLQGMMDVDGYPLEDGSILFYARDNNIAKDVQWIVRSLGGIARVENKSVCIVISNGYKLFRTRERKRKAITKSCIEVARTVSSIKYIGTYESQCISIADPRGLFVTDDFIVTHNSYALLMECLRHRDVTGFKSAIFRKNYSQVTAPGGLWDASLKLYSQVPDANPVKTPKLHWDFQSGASITFAHLEKYEDCFGWQGTELALLAFDELTHFDKKTFLYMLSRNRSTCGIRPYIRATCNPDADSWVADLIAWWINPDTGYPIKERGGLVRYMCVVNEEIKMAESPQELMTTYGIDDNAYKTITFIPSTLEDNRVLMETDPGYLSNLKSLSEIDKERLLYGNWKIKSAAGMYFRRTQVPPNNMIVVAPLDIDYYCRAWDFAATSENENKRSDFTACVLMGKRKNGHMIILNVMNRRIAANDVENELLRLSALDRSLYGERYKVRFEQEGGSSGKILAKQFVNKLAGYDVQPYHPTGSKIARATAFAAQWQAGNVEVLVAEWNDEYFTQLESFPMSKHDDMVDASSLAFNSLTLESELNIDNLI